MKERQAIVQMQELGDIVGLDLCFLDQTGTFKPG